MALTGAVAAVGLCSALLSGSTQADAAPACVTAPGAYAFACTGPSADYATLTLQVGGKTVSLSTDGFQGWVSDNSFNIGGPLGANSNYVVGLYNNASYNNYFAFDLSRLGSTASVTSASLTLNAGLINATMDYTLFGATDLLSQLEVNFSPNTSLYDALAAGPVYDDPILTPNTANPFQPLVFGLNESAIGDINEAIQNRSLMFAISGHAALPATAFVGSVPEPATWMLMLAGFVGLGFVARRRQAMRGQAMRRRASVSAGPGAF
ncbi:MAG TPA: PEP-CTERM sorting domain-containing protein [Roseiarcus sp.]